jgi:hypothetical protein
LLPVWALKPQGKRQVLGKNRARLGAGKNFFENFLWAVREFSTGICRGNAKVFRKFLESFKTSFRLLLEKI